MNKERIGDVVEELVSVSVGAAFLAAAGGPVGVGIATVGEIVILNNAIKNIKEIRKNNQTSKPTIQNPDTIV